MPLDVVCCIFVVLSVNKGLLFLLLCRASIVQKRIIYFQDEGSLTVRLCEKEAVFGETTEKPPLECCACGTAKYRVTFFGNWSEKIHPKDYPSKSLTGVIQYIYTPT
ncbi:unnamed protein product [Oncorhynchus mykiss]|uniref:Spondin domain-containing protein n=1 Tax=Oncorhynchus mykiss TaxID=8022 RepID=A0A060Z9F4_ONCMY|nr:unnamed protein product [Oncorhynchus mykiss]